MRMGLSCVVSTLMIAVCALPGQATPVCQEAMAEGVERVRAYVRGGASLLAFYIGLVDLEIVGEDRSGFALEAPEGTRAGTTLFLERNGTTLEAIIDLGEYRLIRMGLGGAKARLLVPLSFRGSIEASLKAGALAILGLEPSSLSAQLDIGRIELVDLQAGSTSIVAKEASITLRSVSSARGSISSTLGSVSAEGLSGGWTMRTAEGSVNLMLEPGLQPLDIATTLGTVTISVAPGQPFRIVAETQFWRPKTDIPLAETMVSRFPRDTKRYAGERGEGGPLISVKTREGRVIIK